MGVEVSNLRYFGSQSWPFPNSLMIAFVCGYAGGVIALEEGEIAEAAGFDGGALPKIPAADQYRGAVNSFRGG